MNAHVHALVHVRDDHEVDLVAQRARADLPTAKPNAQDQDLVAVSADEKSGTGALISQTKRSRKFCVSWQKDQQPQAQRWQRLLFAKPGIAGLFLKRAHYL